MQDASFQGGPSAFYGWILVSSLLVVLTLALLLIMLQLAHHYRWLVATASGARMHFTTQPSLEQEPEPGNRDSQLELEEYRRSGFSTNASGASLPQSITMPTTQESDIPH
jgi:hypothetical protein